MHMRVRIKSPNGSNKKKWWSKRPLLFCFEIVFPGKRIFLLPRLTGWQHCILKTNLLNHCCGIKVYNCNCADFTFFIIFFSITEDFAKLPSTA